MRPRKVNTLASVGDHAHSSNQFIYELMRGTAEKIAKAVGARYASHSHMPIIARVFTCDVGKHVVVVVNGEYRT